MPRDAHASRSECPGPRRHPRLPAVSDAFDGGVFLSGLMGAGKSTVGRLLAQRLGRGFVDLDRAIEERAGRSVATIFAEDGERAFRRLEAATLHEVVAASPHAVVSLGGGTVVDPESRRWLRRRGLIVTLTARPETLAARTGGATRPLLATGDERESVLRALAAERQDAYAEAHLLVPTDERSPDDVAEAVARGLSRPPVLVPLGRRSYRVEVGRGVRAQLADAVSGYASRLVVTDENVAPPWANALAASLGAEAVVLPAGEEHKTLATVERIWDAALASGLDRSGVVVGIGGGVVTDLSAFAASTLFRGVAAVSMPTTLLAMVDASVGGKTGFDRPEGKNLIGTFHQPQAVLCDPEVLATLPPDELRMGLAEVVKAAWLEGEDAVVALETNAEALRDGDLAALERVIRRSVRLKAEVVAADEREGGARRLLNLGHTVGHALEARAGFVGLRHGEAVSLGLVAAFRVAEALGDAMAAAQGERIAALLARLGLPTNLDDHLHPDLAGWLRADKKRVGDEILFVVPAEPGRVGVQRLAVPELAKILGLDAV